MSWHVETVGTKEGVKALLAKEQHIPQPIKDGIVVQIDMVFGNGKYGDAVYLKTSGHVDDYGGNVEVSVRRIVLAAEPPKS